MYRCGGSAVSCDVGCFDQLFECSIMLYKIKKYSQQQEKNELINYKSIFSPITSVTSAH